MASFANLTRSDGVPVAVEKSHVQLLLPQGTGTIIIQVQASVDVKEDPATVQAALA